MCAELVDICLLYKMNNPTKYCFLVSMVVTILLLCYLSQNGIFSNMGRIFSVNPFIHDGFNNSDIQNISNVFEVQKTTIHTTEYKSTTMNHESCFISLHDTEGRMGNQMFQVASLIGIAKRMNKIPVISASFKVSKYFNIPHVYPSSFQLWNATRYTEKGPGIFTEFRDLPGKNITVGINLESWRYFKNAEEIVRKTFSIQEEYQRTAKEFIHTETLPGYVKVCIHVRRGDFIIEDRGVAGKDYIEKSIQFFKSRHALTQFIVLSDDIEWCKKNIHNVTFSPFKRDIDDMALMTLCDHVIITSGTFGWWGAWLANGITVYFKGYPKPTSVSENRYNLTDYYPQHWIGF